MRSNMLSRFSSKRLVAGLLATIALSVLSGCTDEDSSRRALEDSGFTEVQFTGYQFFACADSDTFHTGFTAKNVQGKTVSGVVCCGWLKSCTVRF